MTHFSEYLSSHQGEGYICDPESQKLIHQYSSSMSSVSLVIGPEGGFTQNEISEANKKGLKSLSLGPRILRTETAPIVAMTLLQHRWGDL